jgi:hypothetical protein
LWNEELQAGWTVGALDQIDPRHYLIEIVTYGRCCPADRRPIGRVKAKLPPFRGSNIFRELQSRRLGLNFVSRTAAARLLLSVADC